MTRLQLQKIKPLVEEIVEEKLKELLGDPDSGLKVKEDTIHRLRKSLHSRTHAISAAKVAKQLGLSWR